MSYPSLPLFLNVNGWGPIKMRASVGMKTTDGQAVIDSWKQQNLSLNYIAVNLGANQFTSCDTEPVSVCKALIDGLLARIDLQYPNAVVWWAKVVHRNLDKSYDTGMLRWNTALDQAAAQRPTKLVLWDWPSDLLLANPPIAMDLGYIHPVSGAEYVKRSTLITTHLNNFMPAHFAGPRVGLPAADQAALDYLPIDAVPLYDTTTPEVAALQANGVLDIDLSATSAVPTTAAALALTVTAVNPTGAGFLRLFPCGGVQPATSNLNFASGSERSAQAIVRVSAQRHLCALASVATDVIISLQGAFLPAGTGDTFFPSAPTRAVDTRNNGRAGTLAIPVPAADAVAVSIAIAGPSAGGTATVYECDQPVPNVTNITFAPNEVVGVAAFVPVSPAGSICVQVNTGDAAYADVIIDVTGTFQTASNGLRFQPASPTRLLDTRSAIGGWWGRHVQSQTIDVVAAPLGARAVTGTVAMIGPLLSSHIRAYECGQPLPLASAVNAPGGRVAANTVTVGINAASGSLCLFAAQNTNTVFDVVGWWVGA
jgi:hypothetical protein